MCEDQGIRSKLSDGLVEVWATGGKVWRGLLKPGTTFAAAVAVIYGVGRILKDQEIPKGEFWQPDAVATNGLTLVGALFVATSVFVALGYRRALARTDQDRDFLAASRDVWRVIQRATNIPPEHLAVHVWATTGFPGGRFLVRRTRFMATDRPESPVKWRKGKGAIGKCWATGLESVEDLEPLDACGDEKAFCDLPPEERLRLSWKEFQHTKAYRAIWVTPIFKGPQGRQRVAGCLSVDVVEFSGAAEALDQATSKHRDKLMPVLAVCHAALR